MRSVTATDLLRDLVAVDSTNPDLGPGAGEAEIADAVARWLAAEGLDPVVEEAALGRPNVVALVPGRGGGRRLMLNAHLDTVGVAGYEDPFTLQVAGGRGHGRGALDTKAGLVAALGATAAAQTMGLAGEVLFTAVADEEAASLGTEAVVARHHADAAVVLEPTGLVPAVAHRGFAWGTVTVRGVAAHGSRHDLGVDAIVHAAPVLAAAGELHRRLAGGRRDPLIGTAAVHASLIRGGQEISSYPAECIIDLERRLLPGETVADWEAELAALAGAVAAPAHGEWSAGFQRSPLRLDEEEPVVAAVRDATAVVLGADPGVRGAPWWTDAALLTDAGIPAVVFGPAGEGLHSHDEWVELASIDACQRVLVEAIGRFCG